MEYICNSDVCETTFRRKPSAVRKKMYCSPKCGYRQRKIDTDGASERTRECKDCAAPVDRHSIRCASCQGVRISNNAALKRLTTTIGDIKSKYDSTKPLFCRVWPDRIRKFARDHTTLDKRCVLCGYDKYVELCHYRQITSFPDTATLDDVNGPSNTVFMCPNHHKELDLGLLDPESIIIIEDSLEAQPCLERTGILEIPT